MITDDTLSALARLEKAATPPPWMAHDGRGDGPGGFMYDVLSTDTSIEDWRVLLAFNHNFPERIPVDRELVAAMRNALPSMLDELAALRTYREAILEAGLGYDCPRRANQTPQAEWGLELFHKIEEADRQFRAAMTKGDQEPA